QGAEEWDGLTHMRTPSNAMHSPEYAPPSSFFPHPPVVASPRSRGSGFSSTTPHPGKQFARPLQRPAPPSHVTPHVGDRLDAFEDVPYRERGGLDSTALDLLPRARCRDGGAATGPDGVRRGKCRVIAVSAGVDVDPAASIDLAELLRQRL